MNLLLNLLPPAKPVGQKELKKLFNAADGTGDGYIAKDDYTLSPLLKKKFTKQQFERLLNIFGGDDGRLTYREAQAINERLKT